jgi:hypothetical protein
LLDGPGRGPVKKPFSPWETVAAQPTDEGRWNTVRLARRIGSAHVGGHLACFGLARRIPSSGLKATFSQGEKGCAGFASLFLLI